MSTALRLLLVRHGESTWNAEQRWQGHADPRLSALGTRQADGARPAVAALGIEVVWSSDLARARRTAELLAPAGVEVRLDARVRERDVGAWTGLTTAEIDERFPGDRTARRNPPGFEGDAALLARVLPALTDAAALLPPSTAGLVVTHGGVIRTIAAHLGAPPGPVPNLGGVWLHLEAGTLRAGDRALLVDAHDARVTVPRQT